MTAVPSDITAEEEGGHFGQWSTEGLGASSGMVGSGILLRVQAADAMLHIHPIKILP